jgi:xylulokinase
MKRYLLGIDIGTSNSKGIISDLEGRIVSSCLINHEISMPHSCWAEHDAVNIWWNDFKKVCFELLSKVNIKSNEIIGIGCSGLGPAIVPIDGGGNPLRPAILYGIDTRADNEIKYLNKLLGGKNIFKTSGQILSAQSAGAKILWFKNNEPDKYNKTFKILTTNGFLVYKLTGISSIDLCNAIFFGPLFNIEKLCWDNVISEKVGIPVSLLPEVHKPYNIIGEVTKEASKETGLAEGTPVIAGAIDTFAEATGAGAIEPGDIFLAYGTTMTIIVNSNSLKTHKDLWANVHYVPNIYTIIGGMATSGALTNWFIKNFVEREQIIFKNNDLNIYSSLSDMAAKIPAGSEGLIVLPYFSGERTPINDELARGMMVGLTLYHTKKHIYRALLEGTAYSVAHHLDIISKLNIVPKRIISAGGGVANKTWTQIVSDVTGLGQTCVGDSGFIASLGNAYMAGFGTGIFKDFSTLKEKWSKKRRVVETNKRIHLLYKKYIKIYKNLYKKTRDDIHGLVMLSKLF